jgi:hypothetical protein
MSQNPIRKAGQQPPGCLRVPMPKASAPKLHQRNGDSEAPMQASPSALLVTEGLQPISSEPAPSHRPWASAPGATLKRTSVEHSISRRTRTELQPRSPLRMQRPRSPQACQRGASPRRILVSLGGLLIAVRSQPRRSDLGCPRLGRDPSQIGFILRQGGKAWRVRLLSYVTQRPHFRLPG